MIKLIIKMIYSFGYSNNIIKENFYDRLVDPVYCRPTSITLNYNLYSINGNLTEFQRMLQLLLGCFRLKHTPTTEESFNALIKYYKYIDTLKGLSEFTNCVIITDNEIYEPRIYDCAIMYDGYRFGFPSSLESFEKFLEKIGIEKSLGSFYFGMDF